ncbi:MAG: hypothetical protein KF788_21190 [Piscinibacter sp.]|nr:hypothetical protein [Piscinibacter sp.]
MIHRPLIRRPGAGATALTALFAAVFATACGGGGDPPEPPTEEDPPQSTASRVVSVSYDYDNNGVADAVSTASYDADGRDTGFTFTYTGDGTPDRYQPLPPTNEVDERSYDSAGNLVRSVFRPAGSAVTTMDTSFDANGLPLSSDFTVAPNPTGSFVRVVYAQSGNRLTGATYSLNGTVFAEETLTFDADGRPSVRITTRNPAFGDPPQARTVYHWRTDGQLEQVQVDNEDDGVFETTLQMNYSAGVHVSTVITTTDGSGDLTITAFRDALGRVIRTEHDRGSDGSVDAVITTTWEAGACQPVRMPGLPPFVEERSGGFGATPDGMVGIGCGPAQP